MRRFRDRQSSKLFRGGELARMMTMIGMLLVLVMIIRRARDADTWRFLANDPAPAPESQTDEPAQTRLNNAKANVAGSEAYANKPAKQNAPAEEAASANGAPPPDSSTSTVRSAPRDSSQPPGSSTPAENAASGDAAAPLDEDSEERAAIADEFQAITDRAPIAKEDMFAYWRLLRWTESAKLPALLKRARADVRYGDLILDPAAYRGELLKVRLHVAQLLKHRAREDNPLGIETYYQALGWNDSSQTWFYFCIFTDLPPGMPLGDRITQEGTFVGYFLKTITYLDGQGKRTQAPVLIGRMVWHPSPQAKPREEDSLTPWVVGGLLVAGFLGRMVWRMRSGKKREPPVGMLRGKIPSDEPTESVEDWLARAESPADDEAINGTGEHESNGNAKGHSAGFHHDPRLDQSEEPGG